MNQQLIFNEDFHFDTTRQAVAFSCLSCGLRINCYIRLPAGMQPDDWLHQIKQDSLCWEDKTEQALEDDAVNENGELWF
ncbi:DUF1488 family protein [Chromatiaceae bacterium AAb-1]|nr:DUF1488 family protein [Chromatiaceae bacterium AAb-1]